MTCGVGYECAPPGGCGEHFRSLARFDQHQRYTGGSILSLCETPEELSRPRYGKDGKMVRPALHRDSAGLWTDNEGSGRGGDRSGTPTDSSQSDGEAA